METIWWYLSAGCVLGLTSAISPGPLLALLVSETLRRGAKAGLQISIVPIITDLPIIVLSLLVLSRLSNLRPALGVIALLGAGFLIYLGYENLTARVRTEAPAGPDSGPLRKGLGINILNPNAYLFWFMVGSPLVLAAWGRGWLPATAFFASFYLLLIGSNVAFTLMLSKTRKFIQGAWYLWTLRFLGVCLFVFAFLFIRKGLQELGRI